MKTQTRATRQLKKWGATLSKADSLYRRDIGNSSSADPFRVPLDMATQDLARANIQYYAAKIGVTGDGDEDKYNLGADFAKGLLPLLQQQVNEAQSRFKEAAQEYYSQY